MDGGSEQRRPDLSVVIPVFRSAPMLRELVGRLTKVLDDEGLDWELVFVDDASPDDAWEVLAELHREQPDRIVAVQLMRNFGQHNALLCGLRRARGEWIVTMDDDLQHPPEEIPKLLAPLRDAGLDLVYATWERKRHGSLRNAGAALLTAFHRRVFSAKVPFTAFRAMRRELARSAVAYEHDFPFLDGVLAWSTTRVGAARVRHDARPRGESGYTLGRLLHMSLDMLTSFSLAPLRLVSLAGVLAAGAGLALGLWLGAGALAGRAVSGHAVTLAALLALGGAQLLAVGLVGEYLGRVHLKINRKPQYVERRALEARPRRGEAG